MAELGIMIEGQEDLTWERLFQIADAVEELGFASLFRSDHLTGIQGAAERESLALWPSLTALAMRTKRIRFGPMVCPMTFRHPVLLAKMAVAVDVLSEGRLDLGIGAGWNQGEHQMFGINYPKYPIRLEMLDEGAQVIKALWGDGVTSFRGQHYQLDQAQNYPKPTYSQPTIIMGGKGKKTLQLVANHATEWNCSYSGVDVFREKSEELDGNCTAIERDPATLRRSVMIPFVIGRNDKAIQARIDAQRTMFPTLPVDQKGWGEAGFIGGTPDQVLNQINAFANAGAARFMLQHNNLDDLDSLDLLAKEVLPHV